MREFAKEIITELLKNDTESLEKIRETWIEEAKKTGLYMDVVINYCEFILNLVIQEKRGKEK